MRILPALVPLLACAAVAAWALGPPAMPVPEPFDADAWLAREALLAASNDPGCVRGGMAADLVRREVLRGRDATAVVEMLGTPRVEEGAWDYPLGQCGSTWAHNDLRLVFDASARVRAVTWR
jgi:hypothetical protein